MQLSLRKVQPNYPNPYAAFHLIYVIKKGEKQVNRKSTYLDGVGDGLPTNLVMMLSTMQNSGLLEKLCRSHPSAVSTSQLPRLPRATASTSQLPAKQDLSTRTCSAVMSKGSSSDVEYCRQATKTITKK